MDCTLADCKRWTAEGDCSSQWPMLGVQCCPGPGEPMVRAHRCMNYHPKGWDGMWLWPAKKGEAPIVGDGTSAAECPGAKGLPSAGSRGALFGWSRWERFILWFQIRPLSSIVLKRKARAVAEHVRSREV